MREWNTGDIEERIREKLPEVNRALCRGRRGKVVRRRPRDKEEQNILDLLCKRKWENDVAAGKVRLSVKESGIVNSIEQYKTEQVKCWKE